MEADSRPPRMTGLEADSRPPRMTGLEADYRPPRMTGLKRSCDQVSSLVELPSFNPGQDFIKKIYIYVDCTLRSTLLLHRFGDFFICFPYILLYKGNLISYHQVKMFQITLWIINKCSVTVIEGRPEFLDVSELEHSQGVFLDRSVSSLSSSGTSYRRRNSDTALRYIQ